MHLTKTILLITTSLFLQASYGSLLYAADDAPSRPNIVFLFADDQNTLSVGCYGNKDVKTPNMDQLARDGVVFDKHYNTTAICMASRANVFTGMYEYKTGCNFEHGNMKLEVWAKSYPVLLREAGYLTAFAGKFGLEVEGKGICESDFDYWGGGPGQTNYATATNKSMKKYAEKYPHSTLSYGAFGQDVIRAAAKQDKPFWQEVYQAGELRSAVRRTPFTAEQIRTSVPTFLRLELRHRLRPRDGKVPSASLRDRRGSRHDTRRIGGSRRRRQHGPNLH